MKWVALLPFTISFRVVLPFFAIGLGASIGRCRGCRQHFAMPQKTTLDLIWHSGLDVMTAAVGGWARLLLDLAKVSLPR